MSNRDPLAQLRDIHSPDPIGWWPLAPGWWIVIAVLLIALATALLLWARRLRRNRYRKAAQRQLQAIARNGKGEHQVAQINRLLKQTAIHAYGHERCATLYGEPWLAFLDEALGGDDFSRGTGRVLGSDSYRPQYQPTDTGALLELADRWLTHHRKNLKEGPKRV